MSQTMIAIVTALALYMNEPLQFQPKPQSFLRNQILSWKAGIVAYRGGSLEALENSKEAIQQSLQLGVQGVHFDIRKTSDGVFVLAAEENLERVTGQEVLVSQTKFEELPPLKENIVSEFGELYESQQSEEKSFSSVSIPSFQEVADLFVDTDAIMVVQDHTLTLKDSKMFLLEVKEKGLLGRLIYQTEKSRWASLRNISPVPLNLMEPTSHLEQRFEEYVTGQFQQQTEVPETDIFNTTFHFKTVEESPLEIREQVLNTWNSRASQLDWPQNMTFQQFAEKMEELKPYVQLMNWNYQHKAKIPVSYFPVNHAQDYLLAKELGANLIYTERPAELIVEQQTNLWTLWNTQR